MSLHNTSLAQRLESGFTLRRRTSQELKEVVLTSLKCLLSNCSLESATQLDASTSATILNYGIKDLGIYYYDRKMRPEFVQMLKSAIIKFEPRIIPSSLVVQLIQGMESEPFGIIHLHIQLEIINGSAPVQMQFRADMDITRGGCSSITTN